MDVHDGLGDVSEADIKAAHQRDLDIQDKHGVQFLTYWFNDPYGKAFCLVNAPTKEAAIACHKESHGLVPHNIIEVNKPTLPNSWAIGSRTFPMKPVWKGLDRSSTQGCGRSCSPTS